MSYLVPTVIEPSTAGRAGLRHLLPPAQGSHRDPRLARSTTAWPACSPPSCCISRPRTPTRHLPVRQQPGRLGDRHVRHLRHDAVRRPRRRHGVPGPGRVGRGGDPGRRRAGQALDPAQRPRPDPPTPRAAPGPVERPRDPGPGDGVPARPDGRGPGRPHRSVGRKGPPGHRAGLHPRRRGRRRLRHWSTPILASAGGGRRRPGRGGLRPSRTQPRLAEPSAGLPSKGPGIPRAGVRRVPARRAFSPAGR